MDGSVCSPAELHLDLQPSTLALLIRRDIYATRSSRCFYWLTTESCRSSWAPESMHSRVGETAAAGTRQADTFAVSPVECLLIPLRQPLHGLSVRMLSKPGSYYYFLTLLTSTCTGNVFAIFEVSVVPHVPYRVDSSSVLSGTLS